MEDVVIRECLTIDELDKCVRLQREVFGLPDLEISPRRHLIVSREAGGWTLGAFAGAEGSLVGFVHHLLAIRGTDEFIGYSHMLAVDQDYQNQGIGARLKWAQRERALGEGRSFIRWTWDPMQARNAHFNLNRVGVTVRTYTENFYGTDYVTDPALNVDSARGIDSDRLFAGWDLRSPRVKDLASGATLPPPRRPVQTIEIPSDWIALLRRDVEAARWELLRVRAEFKNAFAARLVCAGFDRKFERPRYLLYDDSTL